MRPLGGLKIGLQHNAFGKNEIQAKSRFSSIEACRLDVKSQETLARWKVKLFGGEESINY